jgi:hypothetical protein
MADVFDPTRTVAPELGELLGADEVLQTAVRCLMALDAVQLSRSPVELERMLRHLPGPVRRRVAEAMQSAARPGQGPFDNGLAGLLDHLGDQLIGGELTRVMGGTAPSSDPRSHCAFRLAAAFQEERSRYLLVTDQRLIVAAWRSRGSARSSSARSSSARSGSARSGSARSGSARSGSAPIAFRAMVSVPREAVVMARRRSRLLQRGRVELSFVDLSRLTVLTGHLFAGGARRLVAALDPATPGLR